MTKRERRVFGSVRRLSSGRWQVRYRDLAGVVHTGPHTFTSKADAARYLAMVEADLHRGAWADPKLGRITLAEWAKRWQQTTTNLRPTTRDLYAYLLRRFLLPTFGKAALSSIDVLAVRSWLSNLQAQGVSASTRAKAYRLLSRMLGAAVEAGYLLRNPCTVKGAGQERAAEMRFATVAQVGALAEAIDPRYRALVLVAAYGGLRWGELVGLRVKRVDLLHGRAGGRGQRSAPPWAAQDRGRSPYRHPPGGRSGCAGRAPGQLRRARPGGAGVPGSRGRLPAPQQLPPPLVAGRHEGRWDGGAAVP